MNQLSESFTIDELIDKLIFVEKVQKGLKRSKECKEVSIKVAENKFKY